MGLYYSTAACLAHREQDNKLSTVLKRAPCFLDAIVIHRKNSVAQDPPREHAEKTETCLFTAERMSEEEDQIKKCCCKASWREVVSKATNSFWRTQYIKNIDEWTSPHSPDISELQAGSWVDTAHCSVSFYFALLFSIEFITTAIQWLLPLQSDGVSNSDVQGLYVSGWMLWDVKSWQENHKKRTVWVVAWSLRQNKCLFLGDNAEEINKTHVLGWHKPNITRYKATQAGYGIK